MNWMMRRSMSGFSWLPPPKNSILSRILELAEQLAESPGSVRTDDLSLPETFTQFSILLKKEKDDES